jgi:methionyl aminopeptidase
MAPIVKESWEIDIMRQAGQIVARGLKLLTEMVRPGISTADLDLAFEKHVRSSGAIPTFKGYRGYPASICASLNEEVVHGIPSRTRMLREGDIISIDAGATFKGYVGDAAVTVGVGRISERAQRLINVTRESLEEGIKVVRPEARLSEIGAAVQRHAEKHGYSVVRDYVGHGIGQKMHEEPQVPNYVDYVRLENYEYILKPGICIAIEPMVNEGTHEVHTLNDRWTVVTDDRKLSAHFEHTVAVMPAGHEVLTRLQESPGGA